MICSVASGTYRHADQSAEVIVNVSKPISPKVRQGMELDISLMLSPISDSAER